MSNILYEDLLACVKSDAQVSDAIEASLIDEFVDEWTSLSCPNRGNSGCGRYGYAKGGRFPQNLSFL